MTLLYICFLWIFAFLTTSDDRTGLNPQETRQVFMYLNSILLLNGFGIGFFLHLHKELSGKQMWLRALGISIVFLLLSAQFVSFVLFLVDHIETISVPDKIFGAVKLGLAGSLLYSLLLIPLYLITFYLIQKFSRNSGN